MGWKQMDTGADLLLSCWETQGYWGLHLAPEESTFPLVEQDPQSSEPHWLESAIVLAALAHGSDFCYLGDDSEMKCFAGPDK